MGRFARKNPSDLASHERVTLEKGIKENMNNRKRLSVLMLLVGLHLFTLPGISSGITLGEELAAHGIELTPGFMPDENRSITSYGVYDGPDVLFIGFYIDDGTNNLSGEIHLGKFDKPKRRWNETIINTRSLPGQERDASPCAMMAGAVTGIDRAFGNIFVRTHGNPSAGCTLIFTENLRYRDFLYGFFLGALDEKTIVFQHSGVHFFATHYVEVSAYDLGQKKATLIYPPVSSAPARKEHVETVRAAYNEMKKAGDCMRMNHHCNPELFNSHLISSALNPATDSLILQVAFDNKDWMSADEKLRAETFHGFIRETAAQPPDSPVPGLYFTWLSADLFRAKHMENTGWENRVAKVLALFEGDPELKGMLKTAIENPRTTGRMNDREWYLKLNPKWDSPELWKRLIKAIKAPQESTQVVYVYRNLRKGKLRTAEVLLDDLYATYGHKNLSEYLNKDILLRIK